MPETAAIVDPFRAYNWRLEIGGGAQAYFTACSGLGVTIDVIKYREAGNLQIVRPIPGQVNYEPITLYYGLTPSREVFDWLMTGCRDGLIGATLRSSSSTAKATRKRPRRAGISKMPGSPPGAARS